MKIFGKGGKLNIIDIILILIVVAALVFVAARFVFRDEAAEIDDGELSVDAPNITFTVYCEETDATLAQSIIDSLSGEMEYMDEFVPTTRIYNSHKLYDAYLTEWSYDEESELLSLTVEACVENTEGSYTLGTQEIRLGKTFIVKTLSIEVTGYVARMEITK